MSDMQVVLGFDMETDIGSWTPFYEGLVHGTPRLLQLFAEKNVKATCFFTGDSAKRYPEIIRDVAAAGHEVGCHSLSHETVGTPLFDIPLMLTLLPHEVEPRIRIANDYIEQALGDKVVSFRCPRLFGGTHVVNALENLGFLADASYPMYFYKDRLTPYHPSADDWTQEGDMRILEIPNFADMAMESTDEYGRDRDQWPLFRTESAAALLTHLDHFIAYVRQRNIPPLLCFYFHPWEFWDMPQDIIHFGEGSVLPDPFLVKNCGDYALQQFSLLLDALQARGARFTTCKELAAEYALT
ncbi:MAG: polysaccharide deacetylase family protein [Armatimonadota bacterium]